MAVYELVMPTIALVAGLLCWGAALPDRDKFMFWCGTALVVLSLISVLLHLI